MGQRVKIQKFVPRWWIVGLGILIGLVAGLTINAVTPKSYTATATLFLGSPASVDSAGAYSGDLFSQQRASTYTNLIGSSDLAVKVIDDLGLSMAPDELAAKVSASQVPKAVLLDLSVTDDSAGRAADIANAYAAAFPQYVARLETPVGANQPSSVVTVIQNAEVPTAPTSPNALMNLVLGVIGGAVLGFFGHWLRGFLGRTVRTPQQVVERVGAPLLGVLPKDAERSVDPLDFVDDSTSAYAEAIRKLRTNLIYVDVDNPPKTIAFVSPVSTVATTATATNLAIALDGIALKAAVVDANLRQPRVAAYAGVESDQGLAAVVSGDAMIDDVVTRIGHGGVDALIGGSPTTAASELLASDGMAKALAELRARHDFVLFDTPGLLSVTDAAVTGLACDGVIVVVQQGKTRLAGLTESVERLRSLGAKVLGAVLTDTR
jgi:Mrp family chromosome partitioning ATPase/capsular polysaccharide biosynthesis protein